MRIAPLFLSTLMISAAGAYSLIQPAEKDRRSLTVQEVTLAKRDQSQLDQFVATINFDVMRKCVKDYDQGRPVDLDYLATCGDFDLYAQYRHLSRYEAVQKFKHEMLSASSHLEFVDRLSR